jgi:hypothetical protein
MSDEQIQPEPQRRREREDFEEEPRRRRRPRLRDEGEDYEDRDFRRRDDGLEALIPYKNPKALIAYYLGVFSLIPCLGLGLGPAAIVLGVLGLKHRNRHETAGGTGHAIAGIVLGALVLLGHLAGIVLIIVGIAAK